MRITKSFSITVFAIFLAACVGEKSNKSALLQLDKQIDGIIEQMTLEEKVEMLHGKTMFASAGLERLGDDDLCNIDLFIGASAGNIKLKKEITLK